MRFYVTTPDCSWTSVGEKMQIRGAVVANCGWPSVGASSFGHNGDTGGFGPGQTGEPLSFQESRCRFVVITIIMIIMW